MEQAHKSFFCLFAAVMAHINTQRLASGDHPEFDRNGAPLYSGQLGLLQEYEARCWDLFYGTTGNSTLQATTPIHLRSACQGVVYEAVKALDHGKLITVGPASVDQPGDVLPDGMTFSSTR